MPCSGQRPCQNVYVATTPQIQKKNWGIWTSNPSLSNPGLLTTIPQRLLFVHSFTVEDQIKTKSRLPTDLHTIDRGGVSFIPGQMLLMAWTDDHNFLLD